MMAPKWLSKPFYIFPLIALILFIAAQTIPRGEMNPNLEKVEASVEKIYPENYKYGRFRSPGAMVIKKVLVSYEASNDKGITVMYEAETMVPNNQIRQYIIKDKIMLYYYRKRPNKVFINQNYPPHYKTLNVLGVMILVFWGMFALVSHKP